MSEKLVWDNNEPMFVFDDGHAIFELAAESTNDRNNMMVTQTYACWRAYETVWNERIAKGIYRIFQLRNTEGFMEVSVVICDAEAVIAARAGRGGSSNSNMKMYMTSIAGDQKPRLMADEENKPRIQILQVHKSSGSNTPEHEMCKKYTIPWFEAFPLAPGYEDYDGNETGYGKQQLLASEFLYAREKAEKEKLKTKIKQVAKEEVTA